MLISAIRALRKTSSDWQPCLLRITPGLGVLLRNSHLRLTREPSRKALNFTLTTNLGDLDFLGEVTGLGSYKEVKAAADTQIIDGIPVLVLSLSGLIKTKKAAGRARDLYVLPELEGLELLKRKTGVE